MNYLWIRLRFEGKKRKTMEIFDPVFEIGAARPHEPGKAEKVIYGSGFGFRVISPKIHLREIDGNCEKIKHLETRIK